MRYGSVCSGIEAATLAWQPLGWQAAWFAEIEPFPSAVLEHHYPDTPNLGDMTTIAARVTSGEVEAPDVLVGGTPCQAFSVAGMRGGLSDARGQLTISYVELANAIDTARALRGEQPVITVWENVPGVLSSKDNAFGCFLGALAGEDCELQPPGKRWADAGCVFGPQRAIAWRILDAQYFGLAQRRRRVFVVASARKGFDPAEVLFEFDGLRRDSPPSREQGQGFAADVAPSLTASGRGVERIGETRGQDPVVAVAFDSRQDPVASKHVFGALGSSSPQAQAVAVSLRGREGGATAELGDEIQNCLRASSGGGDKPHVLAPIPFDTTQLTSKTNRSNPKPGDSCHTLAAGADAPAIALQITATPKAKEELAFTLELPSASGGGQTTACMTPQMAVRRLTPIECERLQGFPDGYTLVPYRNKPAADGPRYKALGNSMAVPVMAWIGRRVSDALTLENYHAPELRRSANGR